MDRHRSCNWMSGPADTELSLSAARWWIALSRDVIGKAYRRQSGGVRTPVKCQRTPTFVSPLGAKRL
ncbi:MAG: hypothetical protein M3285_06740 [Actinomycetota bacterium]|nr:hypothetical protein [Actinomycetota bacterium]